jgi:type IV pilus assembly protein PilC
MTATVRTSKRPSLYRYQGVHLDGTAASGETTAIDAVEARRQLSGEGIVCDELHRVDRLTRILTADYTRRGKKIKQEDVAQFARNLAITEGSGLPTFKAISMIATQQPSNSKLAEVLHDIHRQMSNGVTFVDAARSHEDSLGALPVAMISAGVQSGTLDVSLAKLADITERQTKTRRGVRSALVYPASLLAMTMLVAVGAVVFIIPTFAGVYAQLGAKLPTITQILMTVSNAVRNFWWVIIFLPIIGVAAWRRARKHPATREHIDQALLQLPKIGTLLSLSITARFADVLSTLLSAQVPVTHALDLAGDTTDNTAVAAAIRRARRRIPAGATLSEALASEPLIPEIIPSLIAQGEETSNPEELLARYAVITVDRVEAASAALQDILRPVTMAVLAVVVGIIGFGIYAPVLSLYDLFSQQTGK